VKCKCGRTISDAEILAEAGRIYAAKRGKRSGPLKERPCPRCGERVLGLALLKAHLATCPAPAMTAVTADDMSALMWKPTDA
jgi:hypothetical protein